MPPSDPVARRKTATLGFLLILAALTVISMAATEFSVSRGLASVPKALMWGFSHFYPDRGALEKLPDILEKLLDTVLMSVAASTTASVLAFVFALFGSRTTMVSGVLSRIARGAATVFRNIDVAVWSMILLFSFGQSDLTGYFALFFSSFGFLTRAYIETIDEVSGSSVEALRATGAGYVPIVVHSVMPSALPQMMSWLLFTIETNIRQATLVGILTGTGIGFAFNLYYKSLNYHAASLVVLVIVAAILLIETISNHVRRVIL